MINRQELDEMLEDLRTSQIISFDTESHELGGKPYRISLATKNKAYSCCLDAKEYHGFGMVMDIRWLEWLLKTRKVILHNAKYDKKVMMKHHNIEIPDFEDTMLMAYLLDEESPKGLKAVAQRYLGVKNWDVDKETKLGNKKIKVDIEILPEKRPPKKWHNLIDKLVREFNDEGVRDVFDLNRIKDGTKRSLLLKKYAELQKYEKLVKMTDFEYQEEVKKSLQAYRDEEDRLIMAEKSSEETYSREDARHTYDLYEVLKSRLEEEELWNLYNVIERPLVEVLVSMELNGVPIDIDGIQDVEKKATERLNEVLEKIEEIIGDVNIGSPKQLSKALFESGMIEPIAPRSEKSGDYSTSVEILEELSKRGYEIAELILQARNYQKLLSTYMFKEDRIYSEFNQAGTKTGRFCVSGDTELLTDKGSVNILKIFLDKDTEYSALTHKGNYKKIIDRIYKGKEQMYEISLQNGGKLRCTKAHRVLTIRGWVSVGELREGDEILTSNIKA